MKAVAERYEVELHCPRCGRLTHHLVAPRAAGRSQITCVVCGRGSVADTLHFMEQYMGSFVRRLVAKPFELGEEALHDPRRFLTTLPGRVVTKPFRVASPLPSPACARGPTARGPYPRPDAAGDSGTTPRSTATTAPLR